MHMHVVTKIKSRNCFRKGNEVAFYMKTEFGVKETRKWKEERKVKLDCSAKFQLKVWGYLWDLGEIFTNAFGH